MVPIKLLIISLAKELDFIKLRKYRNSPLNQIEAIKYGLSKSKGEIICLLDGDDLLKKLSEINKFFQSSKATNYVQDKLSFTKNIIKENRTFLFFNILPNFPTSTFSIKKNNLVTFLKNIPQINSICLKLMHSYFFFTTL